MKHSYWATALIGALVACGGGETGTSSSTTSAGGGSGTTSSATGGTNTGGSNTGGSNTGGGGTGGGGAPCGTPADCPAPSNPCVEATCKGGHCGTAFVAPLIAVGTQTAGDCLINGCDGNGNAHIGNGQFGCSLMYV